MHVIATAGHVDHGKSTLVEAITGIDPDRLEEEKRRGLTIDLGFAWMRLPSGREVGLVDVPGHERFIKNMLAGVGAINAALFVVAANEGWKPQSQEHLDILDLLGVDSGVVAITKSDTVDESLLQQVVSDVRRRIADTSLKEALILPVSALTRQGLGDLAREVERLLDATPPAEDVGRPRLWIDRVFTMRGSGTVVTGTLTGGALALQEEVEVLPSGARARIRGIQSHKRKVEVITPGNRTALNLAGIENDRIERGDVAAHPGTWRPTRRLQVEMRFLSRIDFEPTERGAFKFYLGSAERDAEIRFIDFSGRSERVLANVTLNAPLVADWGDRFVLREAGRRETIGGGRILEPHPSQLRRDPGLGESLRRRGRAPDSAAYLEVLLGEEGIMRYRDIRLRAWASEEVARSLAAVHLPSAVVSNDRFEELTTTLVSSVREHQATHPLEPGLSREALKVVLGLEARTFDEIVEELTRRGTVVSDSQFLRTPDHVAVPSGAEKERLLEEVGGAGNSPPELAELERRFGRDLVRALMRSGELVQVSAELVFTPDVLERLVKALVELVRRDGPITVAQFRDLAGTSRKYAVPLLEYLDQRGVTLRRGDTRTLGPQAPK